MNKRKVRLLAIFGAAVTAILFGYLTFHKWCLSAVENALTLSDAMKPTIHGRSMIRIEQSAYVNATSVKRFDIVCFRHKTYGNDYECLARRVVGLPGEAVMINAGGEILINSHQLAIPDDLKAIYTNVDSLIQRYGVNVIMLNDDAFYVLGDNTTNSWDSRFFGALKYSDIIGKVSVK